MSETMSLPFGGLKLNTEKVELQERLDSLTKKYSTAKIQLEVALANKERLLKEAEEYESSFKTADTGLKYMQSISDTRDAPVRSAIVEVVNEALRSIIKDDYVVDIVDDTRGTSKQTTILFNKEGEPDNPGNTVRQITSFIVSLIVSKMTDAVGLTVVDEAFSGADNTTSAVIGDFLVYLSETHGQQIIVVNQVREFASNDKIHNIKM